MYFFRSLKSRGCGNYVAGKSFLTLPFAAALTGVSKIFLFTENRYPHDYSLTVGLHFSPLYYGSLV